MKMPHDIIAWLRSESARWNHEAKRCRAADGSWKFIIDAIDCQAYAMWFGRMADEIEGLKTQLAAEKRQSKRKCKRPKREITSNA